MFSFSRLNKYYTKSTPIVAMNLSSHASSYIYVVKFVNIFTVNLWRIEDFPTPEFPMRSILNKKSLMDGYLIKDIYSY